MNASMMTPLFFLAFLPFHTYAETLLCGDFVCHGTNPYCCQLDSGFVGCCWRVSYAIYRLWWFWMLCIFGIFCAFLLIWIRIWRRRRAVRLIVRANSEYPSYGTVVHEYPVLMPTAPAVPPSYAASEASKPPPYSS